MRTIKFRVWNKDKSCFYHSNHTIGINNENKSIWGDAELFTGLLDKNGKEIFDGDIVEYDDFSGGAMIVGKQPRTREVIKIGENLFFHIKLNGNGFSPPKDPEVIGNIHQDKHLL